MRNGVNSLSQEEITLYLTCPRAFYLAHIRGVTREFIPAQAIAGSAVKEVIRLINMNEETKKALPYLFATIYERMRWGYELQGIRVIADGAFSLSPYVTMIEGYLRKREKDGGRTILFRVPFRFEIAPFSSRYSFFGVLDELREEKDGRMILFSLTTARGKGGYQLELFRSSSLGMSAYALRYGELFISGRWCSLSLVPDALGVYFLRDHLPYSRGGRKQVEGRLIRYRAGEERGPGIHLLPWDEGDFAGLSRELARIFAAVKRGEFFRSPNLFCGRFCGYSRYCREDFLFKEA